MVLRNQSGLGKNSFVGVYLNKSVYIDVPKTLSRLAENEIHDCPSSFSRERISWNLHHAPGAQIPPHKVCFEALARWPDLIDPSVQSFLPDEGMEAPPPPVVPHCLSFFCHLAVFVFLIKPDFECVN